MNFKTLFSLLLLTASANAAEFNGILVQDGAGCILVELPNGERYIPDDGGGGHAIGTPVHVVGDYDPSCGSICFVNSGCIWNAVTTPYWPTEICGTLIQDPFGCKMIELSTGERYIPSDGGGGFPLGSFLHVTGDLDITCASFCGPNDGCIWNAVTDLNCPPASVGTNYCVQSPNSVSATGSAISAVGSDSLSAADLTLVASNAPVGMASSFFFGPSQVQNPFGNGSLCVGGQLQRLPISYETNGRFESVVDFGIHGPALTMMGTVNFQVYFRDTIAGGAGFNTSDGLQVIFTP